MIEKILFVIISFGLFIFFFLRMIQKNDTNYIYLLVIQSIGILIKFISLLFNFDLPIVINAIIYLLSVIIPIIIIILEVKVMSLTEIICTLYVHICKDEEKKKSVDRYRAGQCFCPVDCFDPVRRCAGCGAEWNEDRVC